MAITPRTDIPLEDVGFFFPRIGRTRVSVLRLDLLHPVVSGNKWFKLKENLAEAAAAGFNQVLTFGGAFSNHLVATAVAAEASGFQSVGIVRGLHAKDSPGPTLCTCLDYGMRLHFVRREAYEDKQEAPFLTALQAEFRPSYIIPEGGANAAGRSGAEEMARFIGPAATHVCLPVGTGTSMVGLRNALPVHQAVIGFTAMKGGRYLEPEISKYLKEGKARNWSLFDDYHFGGFAKCPPELRSFIRSFYTTTGIMLDMVYTGKMIWGIRDLLMKGYFPDGSRIVAVHTGGLQGNPPDLFGSAA